MINKIWWKNSLYQMENYKDLQERFQEHSTRWKTRFLISHCSKLLNGNLQLLRVRRKIYQYSFLWQKNSHKILKTRSIDKGNFFEISIQILLQIERKTWFPISHCSVWSMLGGNLQLLRLRRKIYQYSILWLKNSQNQMENHKHWHWEFIEYSTKILLQIQWKTWFPISQCS